MKFHQMTFPNMTPFEGVIIPLGSTSEILHPIGTPETQPPEQMDRRLATRPIIQAIGYIAGENALLPSRDELSSHNHQQAAQGEQ